MTKLTTVYFYGTVKIVHLKTDKWFFVVFLNYADFTHLEVHTEGKFLLHFLSSDDLETCHGISEDRSLTWETLKANYKDICPEDLSLNISSYKIV